MEEGKEGGKEWKGWRERLRGSEGEGTDKEDLGHTWEGHTGIYADKNCHVMLTA